MHLINHKMIKIFCKINIIMKDQFKVKKNYFKNNKIHKSKNNQKNFKILNNQKQIMKNKIKKTLNMNKI